VPLPLPPLPEAPETLTAEVPVPAAKNKTPEAACGHARIACNTCQAAQSTTTCRRYYGR
jgi:hypothetical protein